MRNALLDNRPRRNLARFGLIILILMTSHVVVVATARGHYDSPVFTYKSCSGTQKALDPINVVLLGNNNLEAESAAGHIDHHGERWGEVRGSSQVTASHAQCSEQRLQRGLGFRKKVHYRLFPMNHTTTSGRDVWFADAHREYLTNDGECGTRSVAPDGSHVVYRNFRGISGFDYAALEVANKLGEGRHRKINETKGPSRVTFKQCNGDIVGWNGRVYHFEVPNGF